MSSDQIRVVQSPAVRNILGLNGLRSSESIGPTCVWYNAAILSPGVFAFLLHETILPCSVPTINFVGIVLSYSNTVAHKAFFNSNFFDGSITKLSTGSSKPFFTSHQNTCPSELQV